MAHRENQPMKTDVFAAIAFARQKISCRELVEPHPPKRCGRKLPLVAQAAELAYVPQVRLTDAEGLDAELARQRRLHAPFLRSLAPVPPPARFKLPLENFDWRLETDGDRADFATVLAGSGAWQQVRIPHYGGPLNRAVAYYRTVFEVTREMQAKGALFIRFKGVDYKAHVFVNGAYLGSHEGFFAPFEFDFSAHARLGSNTLLVKVENDAICMGNASWGVGNDKYEGDKIYAATGPGYDDPEVGWHHCPPGMGIYQDVAVEARAPVHIHDLFVRPLPDLRSVEIWVELWNCDSLQREVELGIAIYGRNFRNTAMRPRRFKLPGQPGPGFNQYRFAAELPEARLWTPASPWLYQVQVRVLDPGGRAIDNATRQFGMRSFTMDTARRPHGRLFLNGREIRLRGANTMGFEQQDVMRRDWRRLIDDILLAKICNMNFWRLTQRPVQEEVYEYCDRLGLMTQTDLPLFAVMRRNQFSEGARQAGEMERLIRSHPCAIAITYINEPSWEGQGSRPWRHLMRNELESFFTACDQTVRLANPDRLIKAVDGDYNPPGPGLPDNHCYTCWYNGHGLEIGKLHRGYWQRVKPGWLYGCGEFGTEGLDPVGVMRARYPAAWLPRNAEEERTWTPDKIVGAQTGRFHYMWFDTQRTLSDWVAASQAHQAWATRLMAEAFRRDSRMVSCAIHLFIDAFPSGWMKTIMDVDRGPKPAYFAYRDALAPIMVCMRSDRHAFFPDEKIDVEAWICNDTHERPAGLRLIYRLDFGGDIVGGGRASCALPRMGSACAGRIVIPAPATDTRREAILRLALVDRNGRALSESALSLAIFPRQAMDAGTTADIIGSRTGPAAALARALGLRPAWGRAPAPTSLIVVDDIGLYRARARGIDRAVRGGAMAVFLELPPGDHVVGGVPVAVKACGMGPVQFVSRATGHPLVRDFAPFDFRFWYDARAGYPTPLARTIFCAEGWTPILASGIGGWVNAPWKPALAAAERRDGWGCWRICQVELAARIDGNPQASIFARRLLREDDCH